MSRHNILFLFADQLQAFTLGCMGDAQIRTPHIDALAADGALLRRCYSNAPICGPYRGLLFTGCYPTQSGVRRNGDPLPEKHSCLAQRLGEAGYLTSYVGKWHLGGAGNEAVPEELRGGFERFVGYQCYNDFINEVRFFDEDGRERRFDGHRTEATTTLAIERLGEADADERPFALVVSYQNPHYPLQPSPAFEALYAGADLPARANVRDCDPFIPTASPPSPRPVERDPNYHRYGRDLLQYRRQYYAMVSELDWHIGRLIAELKRRGLYDSTLIVFTADHGDLQGSHGMVNKSQPHEESSRVPLIVREPDAEAGQELDHPVSAIDLFPTLLDAAGARDPLGEGRSLLPLLRSPDPGETRPIFAECSDWLMVQHRGWKYVAERDTLRPRRLWHLDEDPFELDDRHDDPAVSVVREALASDLAAWWRRIENGAPVAGTR